MTRYISRIIITMLVLAVVLPAAARAQGTGGCWIGCSPPCEVLIVVDFEGLGVGQPDATNLTGTMSGPLYGYCGIQGADPKCTEGGSESANISNPFEVEVPFDVSPLLDENDEPEDKIYLFHASVCKYTDSTSEEFVEDSGLCNQKKVPITESFIIDPLTISAQTGEQADKVVLYAKCNYLGSTDEATCMTTPGTLYDCNCTIKVGTNEKTVECFSLDPTDY
jgi:hypothetical protein